MGRTWLFRASALLLSGAAALAMVELALYSLGLPRAGGNFTPVQGLFQRSTIPELRYQLVPNTRTSYAFPDERPPLEYVISSQGLRDREYALTKSRGTHRTLFIGDSFTFGTGVELDQTFVKQVERQLGQGHEVLNFGVPGYDTHEEVLLLEHRGLAFSPDRVVIVVFLNDGHGGYSDEMFNVRAEEPLARYSRLYRAVRLMSKRREAERDLIRDWNASFADGSPGWMRVQGALRRAAALSEQQPFELAVVIFPVLYWLDDGAYPFEVVHTRIADFARSIGAPALDLYPAFEGEDGPSLWVHPGNQHPNERGHTIAAEAIVEFLTTP